MKALIVYFSGTGNNLYVARSLGKQLGEGTILPIRRLMEVSYQKKLKDYTHIVFCVPSYHSHIPRYVAEVMEKIQFNKEQKIYSIVVCGGNRGHAVEDMRAVIQKAGGKVSGEYFIILPGNYILSYGAMPNLVIGAECQMADRKVKKIARDITKDKHHFYKHTGLFYRESYEPRLQEAIANYSKIGSQFSVMEACIGCGTCEKVCPAKNIHMAEKKPTFGEGCQQCMACVQWCPKQAIDYKHQVKDRKHYHHPKISLKDMIEG